VVVLAEPARPRSPNSRYPKGKQQKEPIVGSGFPRGEEEYFDSSGPWKKKVLVGAACSARGRLRQGGIRAKDFSVFCSREEEKT
jgi:hypothetical protein